MNEFHWTEPIWIKFWPIWILHNKQSLSWNYINKATWTELIIEVVYFMFNEEELNWNMKEMTEKGGNWKKFKMEKTDWEMDHVEGKRERKPVLSSPSPALWLVHPGETSILHCSGFLPHFVCVCVCGPFSI